MLEDDLSISDDLASSGTDNSSKYKSGVYTNYVAKCRLQLIRLSARLANVLTDESVEDEFRTFSHIL